MIDLNGQRALVTGGTRGIGRAIALELARHGCDVALNYLRNRDAAAEAAALIKKETGKTPIILKANIGRVEDIKRLFEELRTHWDAMDILVSNAASGILKPAMELTKHHWDWTLNINAGALLHLAQQAMPMMKGRNANIVATSSLGANRAFEFYPAIGASKAALESLIRHLCIELAPLGIRCNVVNAGVVDTEALKHFPNRKEMLEKSRAQTPACRLVEPEDVAKAVLFLVSDYARMVHGHSLVVDGGFAIKA